MHRKNLFLMVTVACATLLLSSCGPTTLSTPTSTFTPTPTVEKPLWSTPTPTFVPGGLGPSTPTPAIWSPRNGEIERRIPNYLNLASGEECISHFPFAVIQGAERATLKGEGQVDCHFQNIFCGEACVTMHMVEKYDVTVEGEILPGAGSGGAASLHATLTFDGSVTEYFSDYPAGTIVAFTEDNPFVVKGSAPMSLDFYVDGATNTITRDNPMPEDKPSSAPAKWTFILRLEE